MDKERCESCRCFVLKPDSPNIGWCNAYNVIVYAEGEMVDCDRREE